MAKQIRNIPTAIMDLLQQRFLAHPNRHEGISWDEVAQRLSQAPDKLEVLQRMEDSGGEPDVVGKSPEGKIIFVDCAPESPKGRRSVCYDPDALASRKEHKPKHSAQGMAAEIGITILNEQQYKELQSLGDFDLKSSSWIDTPEAIRTLGGALFGDKRYNHVFIYHNGADSYYAARGFRGRLEV